MLLDEDEWGMVAEHEPSVGMYMDPALRDDLPLYCSFIHDLYDCGMIEFTDRPEVAKVGSRKVDQYPGHWLH